MNPTGWVTFQHLFKTVKVRQLPVLPSAGSLVRLRQFQNVKRPLGYGGESPFISRSKINQTQYLALGDRPPRFR